ncbi:MAG TPA: tRNA (adenosine(37)-N6)-threonylcarbamoyltransferase complex ATPase subunit type 1 TsaE [Verrucomicrobiae bacterium]|nr:tRNA (adenosine(37)-N6)-threonylcarbamoyltransferase complex ATPase subunit type 1 TsaE [Verrucomicrobiae bacterium]
MVTNISHSPAETFALGEQWARNAQRGLVIALCGDLGAGKTQLVKGIAAGIGIGSRVVSPTFALVNVYQAGRMPLYHLDLYRLDTPDQIAAAGLEQYFYPDGLAVIEWAERWFLKRPEQIEEGRKLRWVEIEILEGTNRRFSYDDIGF